MKHENIYQHNIRLNLERPDHLTVHRYLMNADPTIFKSKNDFLIKAILAGAESVSKGNLPEEVEEVEVKLTEKQLENVSRKVVDLMKTEVMNEVRKTLLGMVVSNPVNFAMQPQTQKDTESIVEDYLADAAMDYFEE